MSQVEEGEYELFEIMLVGICNIYNQREISELAWRLA